MSFHDLRNGDGSKLQKLVADKDSLVRFHADYCGHCKAMEPEWEKVKDRVADMKNMQVIDVEDSAVKHVPSHLKEGVDGYPTIRALTNKGKTVYSYSGPREADTIVPWLKSMTPQSGGRSKRRRTRKSRKSSRSKKMRRHTKRRINKRGGRVKRGASRRQ
jgi:thiol-disulfide isomerase/thioredoxin